MRITYSGSCTAQVQRAIGMTERNLYDKASDAWQDWPIATLEHGG
jgi:hypothetical protein